MKKALLHIKQQLQLKIEELQKQLEELQKQKEEGNSEQ